MLDGYSVLIKRKENQALAAYYYPDFDYTYTLDEDGCFGGGDSTSVLTSYICRLKEQRKIIPFPQPLKKSQASTDINLLDQWSVCFIESGLIAGCWEQVLPKFGIFSSLMTAATMAMIDFLTIKTTVTSTEGTDLGIMGAVYSGLMTLIIYYFSNASDFSRQIGRALDNRLGNLMPIQPASPALPQTFWLPNLMKALLTTIPVFTTFISSYTHFNQVGAIGEKLHQGDLMSKAAFNSINTVMIIFSIYSKFFFQVSFLPRLYAFIDDRFKCSSAALRCSTNISLFSQREYERVGDAQVSSEYIKDGSSPFSISLHHPGSGSDK